MKDITVKLQEYTNLINIIVSDYEKEYREDLIQDLNLFLYEGFKNNKFKDAINESNYIFICLKHEALSKYKKEYKKKVLTISLDKEDNNIESKIIKSTSKEEDEGNNIFPYDITLGELESQICQICSLKDYYLLKKYIIEDVNQKDLAAELGVSQQAISKRIKKITNKLRNQLKIKSK